MAGFLVRQLRWSEPDPWTKSTKWRHRTPGEMPVASFATLDEARQDAEQREREARIGTNPFEFGVALCYLTSFDPPRFHDWLLDAGLDPPSGEVGAVDWVGWWDTTAPSMTDLQRARLWEALDRVRFFDIVEQPRRTAFVVVEVNFEYNDEYNAASHEGGEAVRAFRARSRAVAYLRECGGPLAGEEDEEEEERYGEYRRDGRPTPVGLSEVGQPLPRSLHFEIVEVELEEWSVPKRTLFLVSRAPFLRGGELEVSNYTDEQSGSVPVGIYADRATAEARAAEAERAYRAVASPFALDPGSVDLEGMRERMLALGIPDADNCPHEDYMDDWPQWWRGVADRLSDEQREAVWGLFDRLKLFEVRAIEVE